jgi:hypothetical protein
MKPSSNLVGWYFKILICIFLVNRAMVLSESYKKASIERVEDLNLQSICETVDRKRLGRHTQLCLEVDRRLASSIVFGAVKELVDDTLYRELRLDVALQFCGMMVIAVVSGWLHSKYLRSTYDPQLPTKIKTI